MESTRVMRGVRGLSGEVAIESLRLLPDFFDHVGGPAAGLSAPPHTEHSERTVQGICRDMRQLFPDLDGPLILVAARYAQATLPRGDYSPSGSAFLYPVFLLAGWIWDDLVDHIEGTPSERADVAVSWLPAMRAELAGRHAEAARALQRIASTAERERLRIGLQATGFFVAGIRSLLPDAEPGLMQRADAFFSSFVDKAELSHGQAPGLDGFLAARALCVGMLPCFELAYAEWASAAGVPLKEMHELARTPEAQRCERLATLHCAGVNDLFSIYKDRLVEDTENLPSVLASGTDSDAYYEGALRALQQVREWHREFEHAATMLPEHPCKLPFIAIMEHMMAGNARFHLGLPRYTEGVDLVRELVHHDDASERIRSRFAQVFGQAV